MRLNLHNQVKWEHHRSGWSYVLNNLFNRFHHSEGIQFDGFLDGTITHKINPFPFTKPFVGVFHNTPHHPKNAELKYTECTLGMDKLLESKAWKTCKNLCLGIYVLSDYMKNFIQKKDSSIIVSSLKHPTEFTKNTFTFDSFVKNKEKKLLSIGHWMRKLETIYLVKSPFQKTRLSTVSPASPELHRKWAEDYEYISEKVGKAYSTVDHLEYTGGSLYDNLLAENIAFLDLHDASASNTIIECIVRNTPVLVNNVGAVSEYLGADYPFYYSSIESAEQKLNDLELIEHTHNYIKDMDKSDLEIEVFLKKFEQCEVSKKIEKQIKLL